MGPGIEFYQAGYMELKAKTGVMHSLRVQALFQPGLLGHTVGLAGGPQLRASTIRQSGWLGPCGTSGACQQGVTCTL